ncbi:hypothetical protein MBLNU459_g1795t2 [Dothideomycetes sp. NU459]
MALKSRLKHYFSPEERVHGERKLVQKLDFFILTFCCLMYFLNYLDRSNLTNAYVSGMKEDLHFKGNQLTQINTVFTCGYVIGQVPSNLALYYIKPRIFFPSMLLVWGGLTMVTAATHNPQSIMAIRFFQALAESSTFVGTHYILGSWYTERELGKRSGIFTASGLAGTMIGGFIQTGIYSSLNGKHGLAGWRWLFIIDGILCIPVAIYGFLLFPDTPATTKVPYLSQAEREIALSRVPPHAERAPFNLAFVKRVFTSWYWYGFVMLWVIAGETESFSSNSLLALYMKAQKNPKYAVSQLNDYPTGVPAVGIVSTIFFATLTDFLGGKRYIVGYWIAITGIVTSAMILAPSATKASTFAAYYWAGSVYACQATFFAWANDSLRYEEDSLRAVVIASMNAFSGAVNAWWSIVFYSANFAPHFTRGIPHDPTLLCVAASTGLLELFRLDKDTSSLRSERVIQITDPSILVLSLTWHPTSPTTVGVTLSSGEVQTCDLAPPTATTTTAEAATKTILQHELEAWTLAFSPAGTAVFSGGDDAALRFAAADAGSEWADRRSHGAGVTAILPLAREADVLVTGSYDDRIRVVRAPAVGRRQVLAEEELGGGVWRLKLLQGEAEVGRYVVLASCMHAGARVVGIERDGDGEWQIRVLAKFEEHKSMNYGSDVRPGDGALKTIVSTSFYDKLLCLWRYELA